MDESCLKGPEKMEWGMDIAPPVSRVDGSEVGLEHIGKDVHF